jgi:RNA polymerase sigma-70 factor (ECF subfamily)
LNFEKYREFELLQKVFQTTEMEQIVDSVEFFKRLDTILAKMPEKTAVIFRLSKIDESPVKKIAEELQMSEKAVEYHITKSLKIMRKNFKNYYSEN